MRKLFIIANWKSNKTESEAVDWMEQFTNYDLRLTNKEIIICPSFVHLPILKSRLVNHQSSISLGAQDLSSFSEGAYTGEVNGRQIKEFAGYVIVGHSERRKNFGENEEILERKLSLAKKYGLKVIFCVQGKQSFVPSGVEIAAYEPVFAIGTGNPEDPKFANEVAESIKKDSNIKHVLYGGSVNADNVKSFTSMSFIDGVLVGGASLNPQEFSKIINNA